MAHPIGPPRSKFLLDIEEGIKRIKFFNALIFIFCFIFFGALWVCSSAYLIASFIMFLFTLGEEISLIAAAISYLAFTVLNVPILLIAIISLYILLLLGHYWPSSKK